MMNLFFKDNLTSNHVLSTSLRSRTLAVLIALITTATAWGENFTVDGVTYRILTGKLYNEVELLGLEVDGLVELKIPSTVSPEDDDAVYLVTSIATSAFFGNESLTSVTIGSKVTTINAGAFQLCKALTSITIPSNVTTIGEKAFLNCTGLEKVIIGKGVTSIGTDAFKGCTNVNEVICSADASNLTWTDNNCDDFKGSKNSKATVCYVSSPSNFSPKFSDVNVTFKQYYDLDIAGTKVTVDNKADILGDGAASYDPTSNTLTLNKDITAAINSYIVINRTSGLTIKVADNVKLENTTKGAQGLIYSEVSTTITGSGVLTLRGMVTSGIVSSTNCKLTIKDAIINIAGVVEGIYSFGKATSINNSAISISNTNMAIYGSTQFTNCHISYPEGAKISNDKAVDANGDVCKAVTILPDNSPGVFVSEMAFPDENFRNWLLSQDYGKSGYITAAGLAGVTSINVNEKSIADLKGIEYFTALENLHCNNNQLTALDMSANTALMNLNCYSNQLTALDVSKNEALVLLNCSNNALSALDVKANTALSVLYCEHDQLTALDVSKNMALEQLLCYDNKLTALDVSKNTALTILYCYGNQIRGKAMQTLINSLHSTGGYLCVYTSAATDGNEINTIQVGEAKAKNWTVTERNGSSEVDYAGIHAVAIDETNFPDYNFRENWILKQTFADDNYLTDQEAASVTAIDISSKGIADLKGIEHFTALKTLNCSGNSLVTSTLDVSKNTALEVLNCSSNYNLTTLDLSKNTKLKTLDCSNNYEMTVLDVSANTALQTLRCNNNQLTTLDVSKNTALTELYCYCNSIRDEGMQTLISSLHQNGGTLCAYATTNDQNEMTTTHVADAKTKKWQVKAWDGSNSVDYAGIFAVYINATNFPDAAFRNYVSNFDGDSNGYLTEVEIDGVTDITAPLMDITSLKGIEHFTALKTLDCNSNKLTALDVTKNTALKNLICTGNQLSAINLSKNTDLEELDCSNNKLTVLDVSNNTALTTLSCENNQLTTLDVTNNTSLSTLYCYGNKISKDMQALINSLRQNGGGLYGYSSENDGNKITTKQVAAADLKGWSVFMWDGTDWVPFNGILLGDANGDTKVDVADIVAIVSHQKGKDVKGFSLPAADVNYDDKADGKDIELIRKMIMKE
ncbi:MAG: leucine-rich repeat domain-containing protein [Prevotella sp.]|nr:leucine-rich repeat domain-containing protein [Prevotella sp.]